MIIDEPHFVAVDLSFRWAEPAFDLPDRPDWQHDAACNGVDPGLFFPERGVPTLAAKAVCGDCPVRVECLEYALANDEKFGIWGGLSERQRRPMRRLRRLAAEKEAS